MLTLWLVTLKFTIANYVVTQENHDSWLDNYFARVKRAYSYTGFRPHWPFWPPAIRLGFDHPDTPILAEPCILFFFGLPCTLGSLSSNLGSEVRLIL